MGRETGRLPAGPSGNAFDMNIVFTLLTVLFFLLSNSLQSLTKPVDKLEALLQRKPNKKMLDQDPGSAANGDTLVLAPPSATAPTGNAPRYDKISSPTVHDNSGNGGPISNHLNFQLSCRRMQETAIHTPSAILQLSLPVV